jgi:hypothetical protein
MVEGYVAVFTQFKKIKLWWAFRDAWKQFYFDINNKGKQMKFIHIIDPMKLEENKVYRMVYYISRDEASSPVQIRLYGNYLEEYKSPEKNTMPYQSYFRT